MENTALGKTVKETISVKCFECHICSLALWVECLPMVRETGFNPRLRHTKDFKNGT